MEKDIKRAWKHSLIYADIILGNLIFSRYAIPLLVTMVIIWRKVIIRRKSFGKSNF